ncbi:MAG: 30S ribosomal protein S3 [Candidatus Aenigmarchaeota archaeon]|nr:30S ribosomal protein S3 [Candidatus Aenigmarchaeota archaeon]
MAKEIKFIKEGIRLVFIEEYLKSQFQRADYSHIEVSKTPLGTRILIYANRPGIVIGRGGEKIKAITEYLRDHFKLDNPQLDVKEVRDADLDAQIIARQIASSLERGLNYKRVANMAIKRVMESGAVGIQIRVSGKLGGEKSRTEKFMQGYLQHSGETADRLVSKGKAEALLKPGKAGIQVKIMTVNIEQEMKQKREQEDKTAEASVEGQ